MMVVAVIAHGLCRLYQRQFDEQLLVAAVAIVQATVAAELHHLVEGLLPALLGLLAIALHRRPRHLQQPDSGIVGGHEQIARMRAQSVDEITSVKAARGYIAKVYQHLGNLSRDEAVEYGEVRGIVEDVQVFDDLFVGDVAAREDGLLVKDGERVAHAAVGFLGYHSQRFLLGLDALLGCYLVELVDDVIGLDALEVVYLAARQDGGQYFLLLGGGEDKYGVRRRLLKGLEKRVEGARGEHVHLIDDEHLVAAHLRRRLYLLDKRADVVDRVVGGGVDLVDVKAAPLVECLAAVALVAGFAVLLPVLTVDGLGEDARASRLAHAARAAEQVGVGQFAALYGSYHGGGKRLLAHNIVKTLRAVFYRRYFVFAHIYVFPVF